MKTCSQCKVEKELSEFNPHKKRKDGLQTQCRECGRAKSREAYHKNKEVHIKRVKKNSDKYKRENSILVFNYYKTHPCVDCGEVDPVVLEFDHQGDKRENIAIMVNSRCSKETILAEIGKCVVRCVNCHRRKSAIESRSWKAQLAGLVPREDI